MYGELYTTYGEVATNIKRKTEAAVSDEYISKIGDVIIPTSGETPEDIATATCVMTPGVILAGDLCIMRNPQIDGRFLSYSINHKAKYKIARIAQGKSIVHIRPDEVERISINYPINAEQEKILKFLDLLTQKIEKQQALVDALKLYKRGVLNQIFQENYDWNTVAIRECLNYEQPQKYIVVSEKYDNSFRTPVLTANKAFILGYTNETEGIYDKGDVIIYDDFTMDTKFVNFNFKVKSSTIKMLTPKENIDLYFMFNYFQFLSLKPEGHQRSYISLIEPMKVAIPSYEKQKHYSSLFRKLDIKLQSAETLLEKCIILKAGLLQQMFI